MGFKSHSLALFASLLLLSSIVYADAAGEELANFGNALDAQVRMRNTELMQSPQTIIAAFEVYNSLEENMPVYILRQDPTAGWQVVRLLGGLPPQSYSQLELEVQVQHERSTKKTTRYAIVGRDGEGRLYGKFFEISEDWTAYEKDISTSLTNALVVFVPLTGAVLITVVIVIAQSAYSERRRTKMVQNARGEYTMETFVFPVTRGRPLGEKLADVMMHPITLVFELGCVALMVALMADSITQTVGGEDAMKIMALTAVAAFAIPFLYFLLSWYFLRMEESKPLRLFGGIFVWGMFMAFVSFIISSALVGQIKDFAAGAYLTIAVILITPAVEETLKGLGIFLMSGHHEFNDTLTGMLLGFSCGAGFAFVENWFYFSLKASPFDLGMTGWAVFVLYRSFFNTLAHGCFTASLAIMPGYVKGVPGLARYSHLAFIPGLVLAVVIHSIFNISAVLDQFLLPNRDAVFFTFNPLTIILMAAIFFLVLVLAVIDEKKRKIRAGSVPFTPSPPPQGAA
ncbi:MAG: PrsW family intramembrane metalloprotease [Candidatus Micrarchaeia archaeon]